LNPHLRGQHGLRGLNPLSRKLDCISQTILSHEEAVCVKTQCCVSFRGAEGDEESRTALKALRARLLAPLGMTVRIRISHRCVKPGRSVSRSPRRTKHRWSRHSLAAMRAGSSSPPAESTRNVPSRESESAGDYAEWITVHPEESSNWSAISSRLVTLFQFLAVPAFFRMQSITAGSFDLPMPVG